MNQQWILLLPERKDGQRPTNEEMEGQVGLTLGWDGPKGSIHVDNDDDNKFFCTILTMWSGWLQSCKDGSGINTYIV
jgi:hypothetical protein